MFGLRMEVEPAMIVWSGQARVSLVATRPESSGLRGKAGELVSAPGTLLISLGCVPGVEPGASDSVAPVVGVAVVLAPAVGLGPVVGVEPAPGAADGSGSDVGAVGGRGVAVGRAVSGAPLSPVPGAAWASSAGAAQRSRAEAPHLTAGAARLADAAVGAATCAGAASVAGPCARAYAGTTTTAASNAAATVVESRRRVRILKEFIDT